MIVPYLYQENCLGCLADHRKKGESRASVVMATGLGKTVTVAFDAKRYFEHRAGKALYLCHMTDILYQARSEFEAIVGHDKKFGFFHGKKKDLDRVDFMFSSFDTMANWLDLFDPQEFDYIVVDESHHSHAETYLATIQYFRPKFLLGITATPNRMDKKDISSIYGKPIFSLPLEEALGRGYLTPVDYRVLTDEIQTEKIIATPERRWNISALNRHIFVPRRDEEIARIVASHTKEITDPRTIVFCSSIKHCNHLLRYLPDSLAIHSKIPDKERDVRLEMFRQGMLSMVITVDCFNEGIDVPRANVIVFLRSTDSGTILLQQLGRGLRKSDGKDKVTVLDFVGNIQRIKSVQQMYERALEFIPKAKHGDSKKSSTLPISLDIGYVRFKEETISLTRLLEKVIRQEPYKTWEEAARSARKLGVRSSAQYLRRYKKDPRLPSEPNVLYAGFPGWEKFLETERNYYLTWQEASRVAIALGIRSKLNYHKQYRRDVRLPSHPTRQYGDFPGWIVFLKLKDYYPTWQEASGAAQKAGMGSIKAYFKGGYGHSIDPKLPPRPDQYYPDYPGGVTFLGGQEKIFYSTWEKASKAAQKLGFKGKNEYIARYKVDDKLPSNPDTFYSDFPGWIEFLGKD